MKARLPEGYNMKRGDMMRQVQKMQEDMANAQAEVEAAVFEAAAGGGAVSAKVNGKKEVLEVKIQPEVVDPDDVEMLEDLLVAAVNEALSKADAEMEKRMGSLTGGMNIPGLF
jgi:DNA-binding YbaB/EbfC family protein